MKAYLQPDAEIGLAEDKFELAKNTVTVGRHPNNDVSLLLESISRFHARLDHRDSGWVLTDLNSSNGTFVNGERIAVPRMLANKDVVTFGRADFTFLIDMESRPYVKSHEDSTQPSTGR